MRAAKRSWKGNMNIKGSTLQMKECMIFNRERYSFAAIPAVFLVVGKSLKILSNQVISAFL